MNEVVQVKPKIVFVSQSESWGGLEMNMLRYAGWMKSRDWETLVVCIKASSIHKKALELGLNCKTYSISKSSILTLGLAIAKILKVEKEGVIWFREKEIQKILPLLKNSGKWVALYQQGMQLGKSKKDLIHRYLYNKIDCWIAPNQFMYEQVLDWTTMKAESVSMIPLAMEIEEFKAKKSDKKTALKQLGIVEFELLFGVIGRIDPQKNQLLVLKAFHKLQHVHSGLGLLILGDKTFDESETYYEEIVSFVEEHKLKSLVKILPYRPEIEQFYSAIDIMVMPSLNESFGRVTLEGMTMGLGIIGANSGGTAELLGHGKFGKLFDPYDEKSLKVLMEWAINHRTEMNQFGQAAAIEAVNKYSHESVLSDFESLIFTTWNRLKR